MRFISLRAVAVATAWVLAILLLIGCGKGGLRLTHVRSAHKKPGNVAVYFKVESGDGQPVGGLTADQFVIYEDGKVVSQYESQQKIVNPEAAASHYTLLLVDMSGSISESGESDTVVEAATAFTERVEKFQKVGVYAFDGSEDLHPVAPFTNSAGSATAGVKRLATFKAKDPSTNLHGAIIKGLEELDKALETAENPMRFGTLVVFSDGTDRAGRVSEGDMRSAIGDSEYDVFAIGLGAEMSEDELNQVGKNGTAMAADRNAVVNAFDTIAKRIEDLTRSYYLLSYCSPARAGEHEVRIEAVVKEGDKERRGSISSRFDAQDFGPGCNPEQLPDFDIKSGDAVGEDEDDRKPKGTGARAKPSGGARKPSGSGKASASGGADFNP
ncbi:MAG: VWA domain-containing protein [Deltaproteobacteria bacterium HGW-Deltaproteobacteria-20]|nr:MAG: VWA domain-containing protein [Deltaproteobacteria bacterium HGW-Deltaproteobacteria-20]